MCIFSLPAQHNIMEMKEQSPLSGFFKYSGKYAQYRQQHGLKKKKNKKKMARKEKGRNQKEKRCKHLEQLCFWKKKSICVEPPTEFPFLKVLFINVYNNSLEEKYKSAAKGGGGVCPRKLRSEGWGSGGESLAFAKGCPHRPPHLIAYN